MGAFVEPIRRRSIARIAWGMLSAAVAFLLNAGCAPAEDDGVQRVRWGTSAVGSSGHRALVNLAAVLNREMEEIDITVLPMPGAIMTIRRYGAGEIEGYYGADVAFHELATDSGRFAGARDRIGREPVQSFWAFSMDMGVAIRAGERERLRSWGDLSGRRVFTGPAPWDTRAHLERLLRALGVEHVYSDIDLGMVGNQLAAGAIDAFGIYATGGLGLAPWVAEAGLVTDLAILNPSPDERAALARAGFEVVSARPGVFDRQSGAETVFLSPFYYGFHLGTEFPEETVYRMLTVLEASAAELARTDAVFTALAEDMPGLQRRGVARTVADVRIHPGLARYLRERGVWEEAWAERVAEAP